MLTLHDTKHQLVVWCAVLCVSVAHILRIAKEDLCGMH